MRPSASAFPRTDRRGDFLPERGSAWHPRGEEKEKEKEREPCTAAFAFPVVAAAREGEKGELPPLSLISYLSFLPLSPLQFFFFHILFIIFSWSGVVSCPPELKAVPVAELS